MNKHHTTIVLAILFCTGLFVLWWADYTGFDRPESDAVLPALAEIPAADIKRIEIVARDRDREPSKEGAKEPAEETAKGSAGAQRLVFERRDEGRWQMHEPFDVAANPSQVETLAQTLKALRKSAEAGTLREPLAKYGLEPPAAVIRVFGADQTAPLAVLDVGRGLRDQLYVHAEGSDGIEVVEPRLLSLLKLKPVEWRDRALFHLPSFRVGTLTVTGPGRDLKAERDERHWLFDRPVRAVAEFDKVEGLVAELTSLQVVPGSAGFVANDVKEQDAAKYGLDDPAMTIELRPALGPGKPQTLDVGKAENEQSSRFYARTGGQDDVVLIEARDFRDLGLDTKTKELRSKKVAALNDKQVEFMRIEAFGRTFDIARNASGWEQLRPTREPADTATVSNLLKKLGEVETSDFLDPATIPNASIDPPRMTISVWQARDHAPPALLLDAPPKAPPRVALQVGDVDGYRKVVYARLEGDRYLLGIPDTFAAALPRSALAFHDRTVLTLSPTQIHRLTIHRGGTDYELVAPAAAGKSTRWQMVRPVAARADDDAVTQVILLLSSLRAEEYITDQMGDGRAYGLHAPTLTVTWTTPAEATVRKAKEKDRSKPGEGQNETVTGTLRIGAKLPNSEQWYANIEGNPAVFTLSARALGVFDAEFHTHRVLAFAPGAARRLVLRWPGRTLVFKPQEAPPGKEMRWVPEDSAAASGFDGSRLVALVQALSNLNAPRFLQYEGPIPAWTGLDDAGLSIEVHLADGAARFLRISRTSDQQTYATTAKDGEASGPVFFLTGPAWPELVRYVPGGATLPDDVFAPEAPQPKAEEAKSARP
jgi:hypothetical protein